MKTKKVVIIIVGLVLIGAIGVGGYNFYRYNSSNKSLEQSATLMANGNFNGAKAEIAKAENEYPSNDKIKTYKEELKYNIDAEKIYDKGVTLQKDNNLNGAIEELKTINPKAKQVKTKGDTLIKEIQNQIMNENESKAKEAIDKGEFNKAQEFVQNISNIDSKSNKVESLKKLEQEKKQSIISGYISEVTKEIANNKFDEAKADINKLKTVDSSNTDISKLESSLATKLKKEKFYNNEYRGIGNEMTTSHAVSPYVGACVRYTREYNPGVITNKSFIDFYNAKIEPLLKTGVIYDLINIDNPSQAIIFAGPPTNDFNKGTMMESPDYSKGQINIKDSNAQYCFRDGYKLTAYYLNGNNGEVPFTFN